MRLFSVSALSSAKWMEEPRQTLMQRNKQEEMDKPGKVSSTSLMFDRIYIILQTPSSSHSRTKHHTFSDFDSESKLPSSDLDSWVLVEEA